MTPAETLVRIDELNKGSITQAWRIASLNRMDIGKRGEKFPKTPNEIWGEKPATEAGSDLLVRIAKSIELAQRIDEKRSRSKRRPKAIIRE